MIHPSTRIDLLHQHNRALDQAVRRAQRLAPQPKPAEPTAPRRGRAAGALRALLRGAAY